MKYLPVGFDLGSTALRAVRLAQDSHGLHLVNWTEVRLPAGAIGTNGMIGDEGAVTAAASEALAKLGVRRRFGGAPGVVNMPLRLSAVAIVESKQQVRDRKRARRSAILQASQVEKDPPLENIEKCAVRAQEVPGDPGRYIIVKSLRSELLARMHAFERAGANVVAEQEGFALLRAFPGGSAIVDVGWRRSSLLASSPIGTPISRLFTFGGEQVTERVGRGAQLTSESAERRAFEEGVIIDGSADWLVESFLTDLDKYLKEFARNENLPVSKVILAGNGSRLPGLADRISRKALVDVVTADLSTIVESPDIPRQVLADLGPSLALAVGLSMWGAEPRPGAESTELETGVAVSA